MKMFQYLKLCFVSQNVFSCSTFKIFPIIKRDAKLLLLRFSTSIKHHNLKDEKKNDSQNQDKVILYECTNSKYFKKMKLFSLSNYIIWTLFGINIYDSLTKEPETLDEELKQKWVENERTRKVTIRLIVASIILGFFLVLAVWFYFLRSIKQIQLIKSTKVVKFQTYSFFPSVRDFSVPLNNVSGVIGRHAAKGYVPIKIKDVFFYYLIDKKGHFPDAFLFDNTVAVKRDFNKNKD